VQHVAHHYGLRVQSKKEGVVVLDGVDRKFADRFEELSKRKVGWM